MRGVGNTASSFVQNTGGEERSSRMKEFAISKTKKLKRDPKCWEYNMSGHARSIVENT